MGDNWDPAVNRGRIELGDDEFEKLDVTTRLLRIHPQLLGTDVDPLIVPIYQTANYRPRSVQHYATEKYMYQRLGNPTTEAPEALINELEGGVGTVLFAGGLAAISGVFLAFLKCGDHLIYPNACYSGTLEFIKKVLEKFGVETSSIQSGASIEEYRKLIRTNTRMIFVETPCNPNMAVTDLEGIGSFSKDNPNILTVVDGTFATPYLQKPLKYGITFSIHSCSKYLGGHTDLIGGAATTSNLQYWKHLKTHTASTGGLLAPFDSFLLHRGIRTLPLRMEKHCKNAMAVAQFLQQHPKVMKVWYPGLPNHPQHKIANKQMSGFGGMVSFELKTLEMAKRCAESVKVINLAVSLGGLESLIEHPASMSHGPTLMSDADRLESGISDGLIRLSVGVEHELDLINDLKQALDRC